MNLTNEPKRVAVDEATFRLAFERDVPFHDRYPQSAYLDSQSGETFWVYENDEDAHMDVGIAPKENAAARRRVATSPDRYLTITGLDHGEHHQILQEFLTSPWTEDEEAKTTAQAAYDGSIGRWIKAVKDETIVEAFYEFRESRTRRMAEDFLRQHGIEPHWK